MEDTIIIIPARIGSNRLARKMLRPIGNMLMVEHVVHQVKKCNFKHVYVATDSDEISRYASKCGVEVIMTDSDLASGTDRVYQALCKIDAVGKFNFIINCQGDMPFVDYNIINNIAVKLREGTNDLVTAVSFGDETQALNKSNVKVVVDKKDNAIYFSRLAIPYNGEKFLLHIGIYGFTRKCLEEFVHLPQSNYERWEKLEQLRALEHGMRIGVCYEKNFPISVDTEEDLKIAECYFKKLQH